MCGVFFFTVFLIQTRIITWWLLLINGYDSYLLIRSSFKVQYSSRADIRYKSFHVVISV